MPKNVKYESPETLNLRVFMVLIVSFLVWDLTAAYVGLTVLVIGINIIAMTSPSVYTNIDDLIQKTESTLSPITEKTTWKTIRPIVYLTLATAISVLSYLTVVAF